ncbi:MAG: hypothetical protein MJ238_00845 [Bacilli bacterium]|nr:hypothetical protein [Bacilli bacterium]
MAITEERIKELMAKDVSTKTLLVDASNLEETKRQHEKDGWRLVKETELNGKYKITFQKVK